MSLVATYSMGTFTQETLKGDRDIRYRYALEIAESYLSKHLSVWLDGNFSKRILRKRFFDLARRHEISEIVVLQCICTDTTKMEERFASRRTDPDQPDSQANDISAYHGSVVEFEKFNSNELEGFQSGDLLIYDSCRKLLERPDHINPFGSKVCEQLTRCGFAS